MPNISHTVSVLFFLLFLSSCSLIITMPNMPPFQSKFPMVDYAAMAKLPPLPVPAVPPPEVRRVQAANDDEMDRFKARQNGLIHNWTIESHAAVVKLKNSIEKELLPEFKDFLAKVEKECGPEERKRLDTKYQTDEYIKFVPAGGSMGGFKFMFEKAPKIKVYNYKYGVGLVDKRGQPIQPRPPPKSSSNSTSKSTGDTSTTNDKAQLSKKDKPTKSIGPRPDDTYQDNELSDGGEPSDSECRSHHSQPSVSPQDKRPNLAKRPAPEEQTLTSVLPAAKKQKTRGNLPSGTDTASDSLWSMSAKATRLRPRRGASGNASPSSASSVPKPQSTITKRTPLPSARPLPDVLSNNFATSSPLDSQNLTSQFPTNSDVSNIQGPSDSMDGNLHAPLSSYDPAELYLSSQVNGSNELNPFAVPNQRSGLLGAPHTLTGSTIVPPPQTMHMPPVHNTENALPSSHTADQPISAATQPITTSANITNNYGMENPTQTDPLEKQLAGPDQEDMNLEESEPSNQLDLPSLRPTSNNRDGAGSSGRRTGPDNRARTHGAPAAGATAVASSSSSSSTVLAPNNNNNNNNNNNGRGGWKVDKTKARTQIRARGAREGHYWIFEHNHATRGNGYYILRCPKQNCQSPVFSSDPFKRGRAVEHLRRCGVEFDDEEDIVDRYAKLGKFSLPSV